MAHTSRRPSSSARAYVVGVFSHLQSTLKGTAFDRRKLLSHTGLTSDHIAILGKLEMTITTNICTLTWKDEISLRTRLSDTR